MIITLIEKGLGFEIWSNSVFMDYEVGEEISGIDFRIVDQRKEE